ncbi:MAG: hypothetical protein ACT4OP_01810 [Actinomycetota bacterium]
MRRLGFFLLAVIGSLLAVAKLTLKDRSTENADEIDLLAVAAIRRVGMKANPFIGGRVLAVAGGADLDLRKVVPAPTGVELDLILIAGSLIIRVPSDWRIDNDVSPVLGRIVSPPGSQEPDAPVLRVTGSAFLSRLRVAAEP